MFREWLKDHTAADFDFSGELYPTASDREFWDSKYDPYYVSAAEKYLGYEWPMVRATQYMELSKTGNRRAQENPHFARRTVLSILLLGEVAEYKGRFLPDIIDGVFAVCEEMFWGVSAHIGGMPSVATKTVIDLFVAETGVLLSMICYMLRDKLNEVCPRLIALVEEEIRRRITDQYLVRTDCHWMGYGYPVNNWTPWILSNILTIYLLMEKDRDILCRAIDKMMYEINTIYTTISDDGGCDEGACYWAVSGGCLFEFCDQLYLASGGKIDFFSDEKLRRICRFEYRMYMGGGYFANFADGTPKITHSVTGLLYVMGLRFGDKNFMRLAHDLIKNDPERANMTPGAERDAKTKRRLNEMIYKKEIENEDGTLFHGNEFFERTEIALVRDGKWTVAAKGGHNDENHNHNDVGSFIIYFDSSPVLVDPSCGTYTAATFDGKNRYDIWTHNSEWHNVPNINGTRQSEGREYRADSFGLDGNCINISFASAYPDGVADSVDRVISVNEDHVHVYDRISLPANGTVTWHFVTPLSVKITDDGAVIGEKFILRCSMGTKINVDYADFEGDERLTLYWRTDRMKRIGFTFDEVSDVTAEFTLERIE